MTSSVNRGPGGTIVVSITFPWTEIQSAYEQVIQEAVTVAELPGFRRGHAPRHLVEPGLSKNESLSHALQHLLPTAYQSALTKHALKPILPPQLQVTRSQEGQDWVVAATTCEAPVFTLPDYKKGLAKSAKDLPAIFDYLLKNTSLDVPTRLVEEETNHRLASLGENLTQLGMSTQNYLTTKKITQSELKKQQQELATADLHLEFILAAIQSAERLASRQHTLDFLTALV